MEVLTRYNRFVRDGYKAYVRPTLIYAHLVLPEGVSNEIGFQCILDSIVNCWERMKNNSEKNILIDPKLGERVKVKLNPQSELMFKGLCEPFKPNYYESCLSYFTQRLDEMIPSGYEAAEIEKTDLMGLENKAPEGCRLRVVKIPKLFLDKLEIDQKKLKELLSKQKSLVALLAVVTDKKSLEALLNMTPLVLVRVEFCLPDQENWEAILANSQ